MFGISLIGYDIVHPLTISSYTPGSPSVNLLCPFLMAISILQTGLWPVIRRMFLVSNLKVHSLYTCNQYPNRLLDLTLGFRLSCVVLFLALVIYTMTIYSLKASALGIRKF